MRCARCPLYSQWNNESDYGEACGLFGDGWDSKFQYEDKNGDIVGCYIDRHLVEKVEKGIDEYLEKEAASLEEWMLKTEKEGGREDG